jgi:hypothetical protein
VGRRKAAAARLRTDERGRHVLQLQHGQRGQLLVDALEHVVVQVPGLVQLGLLAAGAVLLTPLVCLRQLAPVRLRNAMFDVCVLPLQDVPRQDT